jgi:sirohydrochlorin cobaltochelatase
LKDGIVLFAHGSRDPEWARPFEGISRQLERKLGGVPVRLAYLELMKPSLGDAVDALAAAGAKSIRVVPLFLGAGGHVKQDLPRLVSEAAGAHPKLRLTLEKPIGEQPNVIAAIAEAIARSTPQ